MFSRKAKATKLIDNSSYPEVVLCEIVDVYGQKHEFIEKWPVVSAEDFENSFPRKCELDCIVLEEKETSYLVSTEQPWHIESTDEKTIFEISKELLLKTESFPE